MIDKASEEYEEWRLWLGEMILAFSSIEARVNEIILIENELNVIKSTRSFKRRVKLAEDIIAKSPFYTDKTKKLLAQCCQLSNVRNDYCHNEIHYSLSYILDETKSVYELNYYNDNTNSSGLAHLQKKVTAMNKCAEELYELGSKYQFYKD